MSSKEREVLNKFEKYLQNKNPSLEFKVEMFKLLKEYSNLMTYKQYAIYIETSPQNVYKLKNITKLELSGIKFILDND